MKNPSSPPAHLFRKLEAGALAALLALCIGLPGLSFAAAGWTLDQLMASLAQTKTAKASFREIKYLSALENSVESSGELIYVAPNKLVKRTIKPRPEVMQLDGDTLTLERGKNTFTMQVQEAPEIAALIESMRGTLAGDRAALERNFTIAFKGTRERWTLSMTPIHTKALQVIRNIEVSGSKGEVQVIEVLQANGDRSITAVDKRP